MWHQCSWIFSALTCVTTFSVQFAEVHKCMLATTSIWPHTNNEKTDVYVNSDNILLYFSSILMSLALKWVIFHILCKECKILNYTFEQCYNINFSCILLFCACDYFLFLFSTGYSLKLLKFLSWRSWTCKMHVLFLRNDQALCVCVHEEWMSYDESLCEPIIN